MLRRGGIYGGYKTRNQRVAVYTVFLLSAVYIWWSFRTSFAPVASDYKSLIVQQKYPLAYEQIYLKNGIGGAWYIPLHWLEPTDPEPTTILEAAHLAGKAAERGSHTIPYSEIPLIVHQTWKDANVTTWAHNLLNGAEQWLTYAKQGSGLAYFLWLDDGCEDLIAEAEPQILEYYNLLPLPVERSDVFRIMVVNSLGGIYGDIDTMPLRSPETWLKREDFDPWEDPITGANYSTTYTPARLLVGLEADSEPEGNTYWRMGYDYPQQLCQWALASARRHPVLDRFVDKFSVRLKELLVQNGDSSTIKFKKALKSEDPLGLTGPGAVTAAMVDYLHESAGFRWPAVSGLHDDGMTKAVEDIVILPITAFSPGRGKYHNMGSKPITDPAARLAHVAQGSWRKKTLKVELGRLCRTVLGRCKDWSRVPNE